MLKKIESTIEWRSNSEGDLIAFEDSKSLADVVCPRGEAQVWVKQQIQVKAEPTRIVVIGVGSGYHLESLAKAYPYTEIIAIDCRVQLTSFCSRKMKNIEFINIENLEELLSCSKLQELMLGSSLKVAFKSCFGAQKKLLEEIVYFLNIRTKGALEAYLNRPIQGPEHILMNIRHLFENARAEDLPYRKSEVLTLQEIVK